MNNTILYSTAHCPMCTMIKRRLDAENIKYTVVDDIDIMREKGIVHVPVLETNGQLLNAAEILDYIEGK